MMVDSTITTSSVNKLNRYQRRLGFGGWVVVDMGVIYLANQMDANTR